MLAGEGGDLAQLLDADEPTLAALLAAVREPWLARGLVALLARAGHTRALDLLQRAPDHHARHALDALADTMRAGRPPARRHAAAAVAALAARSPSWLPRLADHDAARQLVRLLRDPRAATHAALALATLLPAAPAAAAALWPDLGDAFVHLAAQTPAPHLAVATLALFRALYEAHPCALLDRLRTECAHNEALRLAMPPLLDCVRLHPLLVLPAPPPALRPAPRAPARAPPTPRTAPASPPIRAAASPVPPAQPATPAPPAPGEPGYFYLSERCGSESAPHTPQPAAEGSPPEAAVEATPENTPIKESRAAFQFPGGRVSPAGGRLARVVLERARASPVPLGAAPPPGCLRVRAVRPQPAGRARSCPPRGRAGRRETASQTEEAWSRLPDDLPLADLSLMSITVGTEPETVSPSERLDEYLHDLYQGRRRTGAEPEPGGVSGGDNDAARLADQLELTHALLQYERWRHDVHAERSRRLLGKCRAARALEQENAALRDLARHLQADLDNLRARRDARPPPAPAPPPARPDETDARLRAEAAALAAERERDAARDELGAARARLGELRRRLHDEGRWRSVAAARAHDNDALKRELVMRGEREARLAAAAGRGLARTEAAREARAAAARAREDAAAAGGAAAAAEARAAAAEARAAELEAGLAAREAALGALRREARGAAEEGAARLGAVQDKYRAVQHALRRVLLRRLEAQAGGSCGRASESSPLSASLAEGGDPGRSPPLSDLSRHLLDDDDAPP